MSWTEEVVWRWICDRCKREHIAVDDFKPEGWVHTMVGEDHCAECAA